MLDINVVKEITAEAIRAKNDLNERTAIDFIEAIVDPKIMEAASAGNLETSVDFSMTGKEIAVIIEKKLSENGYGTSVARLTTRTFRLYISWIK